MPEQQSTLQRRRLLKHAGIAAIIAVVVFVVLFAAQARTVNSASVIVALDDDQVDWPYHDAVRQIATGAIATSPDALAAASAAASPGTIDELGAAMDDGQSYFKVTATGSDAAAASAGIDGAVEWAIQQNLVELQTPLEEERDSLSAQLVQLTADYEAAKASDDELAKARVVEVSAQIAQFERRVVEVEEELSLIVPQFAPVQPASPDNNPLRPVFSALGAFLAALAAFTLLEPSKP